MVNAARKNAMSRRNHKERAQPLHRAKLGNLEKHKDYVHRARDYKSKQDRIRKLREIAAFRNKDEFYWGMIKGKTKDGVAIGDRGNEALSTDVVKLLKTQDLGYVRVQIAKDEKVSDPSDSNELNKQKSLPPAMNGQPPLSSPRWRSLPKWVLSSILVSPRRARERERRLLRDMSFLPKIVRNSINTVNHPQKKSREKQKRLSISDGKTPNLPRREDQRPPLPK
ncbi:hypothetical protein, variant [Cryptococcus amylolentus CBS 6039]|uniref:Uncharacterized protein n=1 Tax=Cryptococcus amylolentus CBS 6039 TaxID=1295533 RepID=A0A1E3HWD7_9TREE|nr:hypothetical protein, variant [Cryptococcus amylolentus CBS 6039]ODN80629.1 hypothetical protein, variant [Cryptococcus amylolentus CBS 6039]